VLSSKCYPCPDTVPTPALSLGERESVINVMGWSMAADLIQHRRCMVANILERMGETPVPLRIEDL
jgi:hypothetical protein